MYDLPELREATDALWSFIAAHLRREGIAAPDTLARGPALCEIWTDARLLLGQTCGYPLVTALKDHVVLLATPSYAALGCDGPNYRSAIIVRATERATRLSEMRDRICAVNGWDSNSGMNMLRASIAPLACEDRPFFRKIVVTGAHAESVRIVASGGADIAAIDCVTWAHLQRLRATETSGLRVLAWTDPFPGLPLITSLATDDRTRQALVGALERVARSKTMMPVCAALLLIDFTVLPVSAYDTILAAERQAYMLGYGRLC